MKKIAVFTSGTDAPGMNACIRAAVRSANYYGLKTYGILRGYEGMINGDIIEMDDLSVSNIIQKGGTILKCSGSSAFKTKEGRLKAYENLKEHGIDGLIAIGGNGTFKGAEVFYNEFKVPCVGIPATIDNNLVGTDFTIGYDTAVNTALNAIDRLRDTADSHERVFFIEVMGRDTGFIAIWSAIAGGADLAILPERKKSIHEIAQIFKHNLKNTSPSHIIIVAEETDVNRAQVVADEVQKFLPELDTRVSTLGHIQRGGEPSAADRVLACQLGLGAVEGLLSGKKNDMVGIINENIHYTPFSICTTKKKPIKKEILKMIDILSGKHHSYSLNVN